MKQDLLCTKTVNKKACGEDAANVQDILNRISYHETGKVRGCDIPGEVHGINIKLYNFEHMLPMHIYLYCSSHERFPD